MSNRNVLQYGCTRILSDHAHQVCQSDRYFTPRLFIPGENDTRGRINAEQERAAIAHHELPAACAPREHPLLARAGLGAGVVFGSDFHHSSSVDGGGAPGLSNIPPSSLWPTPFSRAHSL